MDLIRIVYEKRNEITTKGLRLTLAHSNVTIHKQEQRKEGMTKILKECLETQKAADEYRESLVLSKAPSDNPQFEHSKLKMISKRSVDLSLKSMEDFIKLEREKVDGGFFEAYFYNVDDIEVFSRDHEELMDNFWKFFEDVGKEDKNDPGEHDVYLILLASKPMRNLRNLKLTGMPDKFLFKGFTRVIYYIGQGYLTRAISHYKKKSSTHLPMKDLLAKGIYVYKPFNGIRKKQSSLLEALMLRPFKLGTINGVKPYILNQVHQKATLESAIGTKFTPDQLNAVSTILLYMAYQSFVTMPHVLQTNSTEE